MTRGGGTVIGVDIGGTFTDFAMFDAQTGALLTGKCLTTPDDPSRALVTGIKDVCRRAEIQLESLDRISHATTLVTNAIIERKGSRVGLLVTEGFRDLLLMGRESRYDHYDFKFDRPEPLVPRSLTREVKERIGWDDSVIRPVDVPSVRDAVCSILAQDVSSIAICLLHSYRNPAHEREIKRLIEQEFPHVDCTISSDVAPEIREFERASTTVANAYVRPRVKHYLSTLDEKLKALGFRKQVQVMLSNGGISSTEVAQQVPIQLIESGPAAGALAASFYANQLGIGQALAFDMGGTTAKLCCIENGRPYHANAFETARARRFKRGSGLPLLIPVIELMEIGAGGGSIAHVDHLGFLRVGPESAGANPGPAAYGLGGTLPTVTDADVLLGYIDPACFLGGDMALDSAAARKAVANHAAAPLDLDVIEAAWGIFNVVNETMVAAAKRYAAERAIDIRDFTLITFGGAAPIHAWQVARILGITRIVYPLGAGVTSAVGLCIAAPVVNLSRSYVAPLEKLSWSTVSGLFRDMEERAAGMLTSAGANVADATLTRTVDVRYRGQGYEIEVPVSGIDLSGSDADINTEVNRRFAEAYTRAYGRALSSGGLETVTWRIKAEGRPLLQDLKPNARAASNASSIVGERRVYFGPQDGFVSCPVHDRYQLAAGRSGTGPALMQERETTVVVKPGAKWRLDEHLNLIVTM